MKSRVNHKTTTSCFACCFTKSKLKDYSKKATASNYLSKVDGLTPDAVRNQLIHLDDNDAYMLRHFYKEGLRGSHLYFARTKDEASYQILFNQFLYPNGVYDHFIPSLLESLLFCKVDPEEALLLLMSLTKQDFEQIKKRFDVCRDRTKAKEICLLYQDKTEDEASSISKSYIHTIKM